MKAIAKTKPAIRPGRTQFSTVLVPDCCDMLRSPCAVMVRSIRRVGDFICDADHGWPGSRGGL